MHDKRSKIFEGILWLGIGLFICFLAFGFEIGSFNSPGPGFLPFLTGIFISIMGLIIIISQTFLKKKNLKTEMENSLLRVSPSPRFLYTISILLVYIIFIEPLGFILSTSLVMFCLFFDFEKKNYIGSLLFSFLTSFLSYLIFEIWLRCQLPKGIFPWW